MSKPSDNFYVRASSIGNLMKTGRSKKDLFGKTAYDTILAEALLNKRGWQEEITGSPLEKGIYNEDEALDMLCKNRGWKVPHREIPKERYFNDYITGEPDLCIKDLEILADVKNSHTPKTFPWLVDCSDLKKHNDTYWWQLQGYMWLTGIHTSYLAYCLTDFPEHMISSKVQSELYKAYGKPEARTQDMSEIEDKVESKIRKQMTFPQWESHEKIRVFKVELDTEAIEELKNRIVEARLIYDTIYKSI